MEWIKNLNHAIAYIECHLTDEIDNQELGRIACCSSYHFQRMFVYMANVSLSEYIRRRKMSLAAVDLQNGGKIIDISLKYGYSSPTAFNRAFQAVHGIAPSQVKASGASVKSFPPLTFTITIKGAEEMNYRVEKKEAFRIVGVSKPLGANVEENFTVVPQLWQEVSANGTIPRLVGIMNAQPMGILGVSQCSDNEQWKYSIAVSSSAPLPEDLEESIIPSYTWAIFPGEGVCPQAIQELERRIVTEWLPTSGYEYDNGPDIEVYLEPNPANAKFEVWIPIVPKKA